ncbi:hypothetical protein chiPu_0001466 [Chiloscyllium punctatum]|uniref:Uncharacterized protein n=1 Tax=Chiloscyllium punctatum TaxID=137246 RepID=A0A401RY47_CHIPU|nr:hypothetical protein [Chiloscyllium punctatum]
MFWRSGHRPQKQEIASKDETLTLADDSLVTSGEGHLECRRRWKKVLSCSSSDESGLKSVVKHPGGGGRLFDTSGRLQKATRRAAWLGPAGSNSRLNPRFESFELDEEHPKSAVFTMDFTSILLIVDCFKNPARQTVKRSG